MHNQHNAIAQRIDRLRKLWVDKSAQHPDWQLARWLIEPEDADLLTGLLKLESSTHGQLPEVFVVLFTPFEKDSFSKDLVTDWLQTYQQEQEKYPDLKWEAAPFEKQLQELPANDPGHILLFAVLQSFVRYLDDSRTLVLSLVPRQVTSFPDYNQWLSELHQLGLPDQIKLMVLDHLPHRYLEKAMKKTYPNSFTVEPGDMDMKGAIEQLATEGNPADPQVQFRKCMFKMGKAASSGNRADVHLWGEKMLKITQKTGDKNFFASAHLVYAGFLLHFKGEEKTKQLLDQGIRIAKKESQTDASAAATLMQLYAYQGARASMDKKYAEAVDWFMLQAKTGIEADLSQMAIGAYKMAIFTAHQRKLKAAYQAATQAGYATGKAMEDEALKTTEYAFVAYHFLQLFQDTQGENCHLLDQRMIVLYGENWQQQTEILLQQAKKKREVPNAAH